MDNYWQQNRLSSYYRAMANAESKELSRVANSASLMHLRDGFVRMQFQDEISLFIREQLNKLSYAKTEDEFQACLNDIQQEKAYLIQQDQMLTSGEARIHASVSITEKNGIIGYVLNGVGVVIGTFQVIAGLGAVAASVAIGNPIGIAFGALLIVHGTNEVYETTRNLISGSDINRGPLKSAYISGAEFLGFSPDIGEIAYNSAHLSLSGYGIFRMALKPNAYRLHYYLPQDYVRYVKLMSKRDLAIESTANIISTKNILSKLPSSTTFQEAQSLPAQPHSRENKNNRENDKH